MVSSPAGSSCGVPIVGVGWRSVTGVGVCGTRGSTRPASIPEVIQGAKDSKVYESALYESVYDDHGGASPTSFDDANVDMCLTRLDELLGDLDGLPRFMSFIDHPVLDDWATDTPLVESATVVVHHDAASSFVSTCFDKPSRI
eukprot:3843573-Amphidinium_carterae.1